MPYTLTLPNPLREGIRMHRTPDPCALVIFGASGDLTARKLVPALHNLARQHMLPSGFSMIGCSKTPFTHEQFRDKMRKAVRQDLNLSGQDDPVLNSFTSNLYYISDDFGDPGAYSQLTEFLNQLDRDKGTSGNRLFYLATPPSFFPVIVKHLGGAALAKPQNPEKNWAR